MAESSQVRRAGSRLWRSIASVRRKRAATIHPSEHRSSPAEDRLNLALRTADVGVYDYDHRNDTLDWTPTLCALLGLQASVTPSLERYLGCAHPDDLPRLRAALQHADDPTGEGRCDIEHRIVRPDAEVRWAQLRSVTTFAGRGATRKPLRTLGTVVDITAQKRLDHHLQVSNARLAAMYNGVADFIGLIELDGTLLEANRAALQYVGATLEEVHGKPFWDSPWWRHSATERARLKQAIVRAANGEIVQFETTHRSATGEIDDVDFALYPVRNAEGVVTQIVPEGRCITPLKNLQRNLEQSNLMLEDSVRLRTQDARRALNGLQESEARLRAIVDNAVQGIVTIDEQGIMESVNPAACVMFGYGAEELIGNNVNLLMPSPDRERHTEYLDRYRRTGEKKVIGIGRELVGKRKDGSELPLDLAVSEGHIRERRIFTGMMQDLTRRKEAERAVRETEQRLTASVSDLARMNGELLFTQQALEESGRFNHEVLESVNEGIVVYDRDLRCIARNRFMEDLSGIPNTQVLGRKIREQFPELESHGIWNALERALAGETVVLDHPLGRRRGTEHFLPAGTEGEAIDDAGVAWTWPVYHPYRNKHGAVIGVILVVTDGTARKRAEDEIKRQHARIRALAQALESTVEQERRHLARELHDELAQLLTALRIDIGWLSRKLDPSQEILIKRTAAMSQVIDRIQAAVKRIAASLRPKALDDLGLVHAIEALVKEFSERTRITCEFQVPAQPLSVPDPLATILYRVVQEALTNIAKHAQATQCHIVLTHTDDFYTLTIRDNGKGLSDADLHKERSFGLIGIRERIAGVSGSVHIESTSGQGTTLIAKIPITRRTLPAKGAYRA